MHSSLCLDFAVLVVGLEQDFVLTIADVAVFRLIVLPLVVKRVG